MRKTLLIALLAFLCMGCTACLASCFPSSEGGFLDYITGNSLTRDKASWEAERQRLAEQARIEAERARKAEAAADEAGEMARQHEADAVAAQAAAEAAHAEALEAQARSMEAEQEVQLERAKGDNYEKKAIAQALTNQTRAHIALQGVMVIFALFGLGAFAAFIFDLARRHPYY